MNNILSLNKIVSLRKKLKTLNKKVVFTNGCFDILHAGHLDYLIKAKQFGDILIVALNSDASIKKIKGINRPIIPQDQRAFIISNLKPVDYVLFFDDDTPENVIDKIIPDILVKGADWDIEKIVGKDVVINNGGSVKTIEFIHQQSTSKIINKILEVYSFEKK